METAISIILEALAVGSQAAVKDVANGEIKHLYNWLKSNIKEKWVGKPDAETVLAAYAEDSKSWSKEVLAQKLEESGIYQDKYICRKAEELIRDIQTSVHIENSQISANSNKQESVESGRTHSSGDTVTGNARLDKSIRSVGTKGTYYEGPYTQINNRQTRLALLFGILALVLVGVVVYLIKTDNIPIQILWRQNEISSPTSSQSTAMVDDVEVQIRQVANSGDSPEFLGVATNVGRSEIKEFHIVAVISEMGIEPGDLSSSKIVSVIDTVRNLKPGETRQIGGYFNLEDAWMEELPESYRGQTFDYRVYWGDGYRWDTNIADTDSLETCTKALNCAQKYMNVL